DCNVNSASDAIKFSDAPMQVRKFNTIQKLIYLQTRDGLPMQRHQAYGSLITRLDDRQVLLNDGASKHVHNLARQRPLIPGRFLDGSHAEAELQGSAELSASSVSWPCAMPRCR
ncbi:unnamed protein product, partial [Effrenium voratum]